MTGTVARMAAAKHTLLERQQVLQADVRRRIRGKQTERPSAVGDAIDQSEADMQGDLDLALLEMQAETLTRVDAALARVDAGQYGACAECDQEISDQRLRAMPFAVRCQACEQRREQGQPLAIRAWGLASPPDATGL